jgi:adenylosuccinate synthase
MNISVVVGTGFGDEGKGATVNSLCNGSKKTLVVRHQAGHQVGHTVVLDDIRHVFSNFGSGTLRGVPTYWSEYCTVDPIGVLREGDALRLRGIFPDVYYNLNAMVTTPYDKYLNISDSVNNSHGTVGVGFGKTIQRNEDYFHLYIRDLLFPKIRNEKLRLIREYYYNNVVFSEEQLKLMDKQYDDFISACDDLVYRYMVVNGLGDALYGIQNLIFEGGQGILLDQNYGFFPHVTRSNTTSKNAMEIIKKNKLHKNHIITYYVTRAYQTRHGNGFLSNEDKDNSYIKINPKETNLDTGSQGVFRRSMLDLDMLQYALSCDRQHNLS